MILVLFPQHIFELVKTRNHSENHKLTSIIIYFIPTDNIDKINPD